LGCAPGVDLPYREAVGFGDLNERRCDLTSEALHYRNEADRLYLALNDLTACLEGDRPNLGLRTLRSLNNAKVLLQAHIDEQVVRIPAASED
jgi:hypothetical protein